ncbi:MAG: hypothetical protein JWM47_2051 [Acidimicrobiales bacterium]|nr:hypothetical protein [Acidimicrobiales bacterium]
MTDSNPQCGDPRPGSPAHEAAGPAVVSLSPVEAAIADAVALLSGPGLGRVQDPPTSAALEAQWGADALAGLAALRADLDGRRVGLAISGGGALGSFEAGALRFLYDFVDLVPVAVAGNSAGALNAAQLAHGDGPDGRRAIDELEDLWRSMRINPDMWEPEPWLARILASAQWATAIRGQISSTSSATNAVRVAARVVSSLVRRPEETDGTLDAIKDALKAQSLLSLGPVADLIDRHLDVDRVRASGIALRVGTVSLESGELRYVTETGALHDRRDQPLDLPPVRLADGILASASIPMAFPPVLLGDEHYVDGGAREILPLEVLVEHLEVERAIAISASSATIDRAGSFANRSLLDILRRVSAEIATNETLRKELNPPGGWGPAVRLVVPEIDVHDAMTIDPALIAISLDYGWLRAADVLLGLDQEARGLSTTITLARMGLRAHAGPLPSLFGADDGDRTPAESVDSLTSRLRDGVRARRHRGLPVPPSLLAWDDASADPAALEPSAAAD